MEVLVDLDTGVIAHWIKNPDQIPDSVFMIGLFTAECLMVSNESVEGALDLVYKLDFLLKTDEITDMAVWVQNLQKVPDSILLKFSRNPIAILKDEELREKWYRPYQLGNLWKLSLILDLSQYRGVDRWNYLRQKLIELRQLPGFLRIFNLEELSRPNLDLRSGN